jgi:hypothetical protein
MNNDDHILILHKGRSWRRRQVIAISLSFFTFLLSIGAWTYVIWQFSALYHADEKLCSVGYCLEDLEKRVIEAEGKLSRLRLKLYKWEKLQRKEVDSEGKGDAS